MLTNRKFQCYGHENKVLKLKKALYGLKQAPRAWCSRLDNYLQKNDFSRYLHEYALYVKKDKECGVKLSKDDGARKVDSTTFRSLVRSLWYLTCSRPDILFAVGLVSRFMENPSEEHMNAAKRILRSLKGTFDYGIFYTSSNDVCLKGYCYSDYASDVDDRKSTTGFVFYFGENAISWCSKKQPIVTLSTCDSEYVATTAGTCHAIWLRRLLSKLYYAQDGATKIMVENKSTIALAKNPVFHDRSKHIDVRFHFIRDCVANKEIEMEYVKTLDQVADIFIKALKKDRFQQLRG
ncbi:UNVERIFIED_CONTAM: Retrovirus-related Pol polyprotein from transposon RE1 [Sesamum latifolium]|uniref:Retrovirus-related Pol polyprotein from transposon RE1 n=1 Tax=Sesamum latifolium TaxID=2727402 RepID=A0AAW2XUS8_9LAMI